MLLGQLLFELVFFKLKLFYLLPHFLQLFFVTALLIIINIHLVESDTLLWLTDIVARRLS